MNLCNGYKLSNGMKLRKDKFWNEELKMSEVCKVGAISKTTVGNLISRTTLDKELESIYRVINPAVAGIWPVALSFIQYYY